MGVKDAQQRLPGVVVPPVKDHAAQHRLAAYQVVDFQVVVTVDDNSTSGGALKVVGLTIGREKQAKEQIATTVSFAVPVRLPETSLHEQVATKRSSPKKRGPKISSL